MAKELNRLNEAVIAGDKYRDTVIQKADLNIDGMPMWFGWVIMDAFLSGIKYERDRTKGST